MTLEGQSGGADRDVSTATNPVTWQCSLDPDCTRYGGSGSASSGNNSTKAVQVAQGGATPVPEGEADGESGANAFAPALLRDPARDDDKGEETRPPGQSVVPYSPYPMDDGFLGGYSEQDTLKKDVILTRYAWKGRPDDVGYFFAPAGVSFSARSMPGSEADYILRSYVVLRDLPVRAGLAAPYLGQPGLGVQYLTTLNASELVREHYLMPRY